ncbi:hypothetical protein ACW0JT_07615 [Arthrobacter sp. SA17]
MNSHLSHTSPANVPESRWIRGVRRILPAILVAASSTSAWLIMLIIVWVDMVLQDRDGG